MSRLTTFILLFSALAFATDTPTYEKGTITRKFAAEPDSSAHAYYDLQGSDHSYQVKICADFSDGQSVDFRVKGNDVFIRAQSGKDIKCGTTAVMGKPITYSKGTIAGYEIRFFPMGNGVRKAKIYDLRGPDLIYQFGFCGTFQAGEFTTGQVADFRLDGKRLYVLHDNDKEYSCQLEGTLKLQDFQPADPGSTPEHNSAPVPVAPAPASTAKLSIASVPSGADVEIDGNFSGNTPSDLQVPDGEHTITVKKPGYKDWERKLKVVAGSSIHLNAELETQAAQ